MIWGWLIGRRSVGLVSVAVGVAALMCCSAAQVASARVAHDPCNQHDPFPHVTADKVAADGLHCGGIFGIPGHRTEWTPEKDAPPPCRHGNALHHGEAIPGFGSSDSNWWITVHSAEWDYWTGDGQGVLWDGGFVTSHWTQEFAADAPSYWQQGYTAHPGRGGHSAAKWVTLILPRFHNWSHLAWPVRVYFHCKHV